MIKKQQQQQQQKQTKKQAKKMCANTMCNSEVLHRIQNSLSRTFVTERSSVML